MSSTKGYVQVGFLRHSGNPSGPEGFWVECLECGTGSTLRSIPILDINLRPYRQPCGTCGKELIEPNVGVILYKGRPA